MSSSTNRRSFLARGQGVPVRAGRPRLAPVIKTYTGAPAAADVYTANTTFVIRLDLGVGSQVPA